MNDTTYSRRMVFLEAFRYTVPVFLGYIAIGVAFGLFLTGTGYPPWLALIMSLWMYAGAGQFIAVGLFASGVTLWEACLVQLVVNARHMAYGLSMLKRFRLFGAYKPYMIFSLTDETFALLSSLPEEQAGENPERRRLFMFYAALLDQSYWVAGSVAGAIAGSFIPFDMEGIGFALTALFVVLLVEQIQRVRKAGIFVLSAAAALGGVFLLPGNLSLLGALAVSLVFAPLAAGKQKPEIKS